MKYTITINEADFALITTPDVKGSEHLVHCFGGTAKYCDTTEFVVRTARPTQEHEYVNRSRYGILATHELCWEVWNEAEVHSFLMMAHSHPRRAFFSTTDIAHDERAASNILEFTPYFIRLVSAPDGIVSEVISREDKTWKVIDSIKIVGPNGIRWVTPKNAPKQKEMRIDRALHDRTLRLGKTAEKMLEKIGRMILGFVGLGGGNIVALQILKHLTPKKAILVDPDIIEEHTANRFLGYKVGDVGASKVSVAEREVKTYQPCIEVETIQTYFPNDETITALKEADIILSFPDNDETRFQLAHFAARYHISIFDAGTLVTYHGAETPQRITGRILTQTPGGPCLACLGVSGGYAPEIENETRNFQASYSDRPDLAPAPQVITTNAFAATLLVRNILTWCYPELPTKTPTYLQFEELVPSIENLTDLFPKRIDCPICGEGTHASRGRGDNPPEIFPESPPEPELRED